MEKRNILDSFRFAIEGLIYAVRFERNMKIHAVMSCIFVALGFYVRLSGVEFILLFLTISSVMLAELLNTCIEAAIDHTTNGEFHPNVKIVKDIGAGAVLVTSVAAAIIGFILFLPKFF